MSSVLFDIIRNVERSNSILIKDTLRATPGRKLLRCFASSKNVQSHVFVNEVDPCVWREGSIKSYLYDKYSDPLHWEDDTSESQLSATSFITSIATRVKTAGPSLPDNHYVIIDSLSVLLRRHGLSVVTKLLDALTDSQLPGGGQVACVISYLHGDVHSDNDVQCLEQMVPTVVSLEKSPVASKQLCSITHLRRSGKILHKKEIFHIAEDLSISSTEYLPSVDHIQHVSVHMEMLLYTMTGVDPEVNTSDVSHVESGDTVDPTVGLPFNLTLSDKEKKDRSQVRLPYKYTETQKAERLEGRVFYEPDAIDDWDDSDPDDDLDI